jgi:DNA-binding XRE family transcriptional regulator
MSQAELARKVGVTKQAINNIEHGISIPNVNTAMLIAIALGTTVDYLVGTEEKRIKL